MSEVLELEVSADVLAALTGMSRRWVFDRATDGTIARVGRGKFPLGESLPALIAFMTRGELGEELDKARLRKLNADATRAELELAKERGEVAPIYQFSRVWADRFAIIQRTMRHIPQRAVLQLLNEPNETVWKQKLLAEIDLALNAAANEPLQIEDEDADDEQTD